MADTIMFAGGFVFLALFSVMAFTFVLSLISLFIRKTYPDYKPNVSIIIPCYNEEKNIIKCIDALLDSDYPKEKTELIVVDDGSTDSTINVLREYRQKEYQGKKGFADFKIAKSSHKGKSEALNAGIKLAKNEIVFCVDADTIVSKDTLFKMARPFSDEKVGATNGSCIVRNRKNILGMFQTMEYHFNNLIKKSFSDIFGTSIWLFGAFACYRKNIIEKIGSFKKDSLTEDMDIMLELNAAGYKTVNVHDAFGKVHAPDSFHDFFRQRTRWWIGGLQALFKHRKLFSFKSRVPVIFLFLNQYWWSFYAFLSIPLIAYQYNYWLGSNIGSFYDWFMYTFKWFSAIGPFNVIYHIPEWGINFYSIFGVIAGLMMTIMLFSSALLFKEKNWILLLVAVLFYFPYTILLNTIILISSIRAIFLKDSYFIR
jgi:cellulose synthase/poly-beta-1,6-N-acetylglucosamine synthase-like glycosyltransferase